MDMGHHTGVFIWQTALANILRQSNLLSDMDGSSNVSEFWIRREIKHKKIRKVVAY
jgi:hypothetical protein